MRDDNEKFLRSRNCKKKHSGRVAQVARATALQAVGHRFKSCPAYLPCLPYNKKSLDIEKYYGLVAQFGLARLPVTQEVAGSSPVGPVSITLCRKSHRLCSTMLWLFRYRTIYHIAAIYALTSEYRFQATPTIEERHRRD